MGGIIVRDKQKSNLLKLFSAPSFVTLCISRSGTCGQVNRQNLMSCDVCIRLRPRSLLICLNLCLK